MDFRVSMYGSEPGQGCERKDFTAYHRAVLDVSWVDRNRINQLPQRTGHHRNLISIATVKRVVCQRKVVRLVRFAVPSHDFVGIQTRLRASPP